MRKLLLLLLFFLLVNIVSAAEPICIVYFYGEGCPHCAEVKPFIDSIEQRYSGQIMLHKYEIYHNLKNYQLYNEYCAVNNVPVEQRGIPFVAIGDSYFIGTDQIKANLGPAVNELLATGVRICPLPGQMTCHPAPFNQSQVSPIIPFFNQSITLPLILFTGLVDGINPCAFAVLIFLLTFLISVSSSKKRMIKAGVAYVVAVYISYFLAGLGLLSIIQVSGLSLIIVKLAAILAIVAGLVNVKDFFWYGRGFSLQIPESRKGLIQNLVYKANIPAAVVLGFLVSMFELPCTGGVYLAILAMLANTVTRATAVGYLLVYNLMFILPLLVIVTLITFGMKAEHIESWRSKKKNWMKLVMGIILLILGIGLLLGWF